MTGAHRQYPSTSIPSDIQGSQAKQPMPVGERRRGHSSQYSLLTL